jgi:hypothetical protein
MSNSPQYGATEEVLVLLISETVNGSPQRRLAAKFVLNCLRHHYTKEEMEACLDELEHRALLDIADDARALASSFHLIP